MTDDEGVVEYFHRASPARLSQSETMIQQGLSEKAMSELDHHVWTTQGACDQIIFSREDVSESWFARVVSELGSGIECRFILYVRR